MKTFSIKEHRRGGEYIVGPTALGSRTAYLVYNEVGRYSFGDKVPGLQYADDGSLTIYIQPDAPEGDKAANWLPSPKGKDFNLFLRAYFPGKALLDQSYAAPPVRKLVQ